MTTKTYTQFNARKTPQNQPIHGKNMVQNSAGGFGFKINDFTLLDRFLILGTLGNTYYASEKNRTIEAATNIVNFIKNGNGRDIVNRVVEISVSGRAPKNDPALFVLALVMTYGDNEGKRAAQEALPQVARIGTHILHFGEYVNGLRGWGRSVRKSVANWYTSQTPHGLAMNMLKYANRDGWTHADLIRLSHPKTDNNDISQLMRMAIGKDVGSVTPTLRAFLDSVENLKNISTASAAARLISDNKLPREFVPTELLNSPEVWEALLPHMGLTAMVRNLATMTRVGVLKPLSYGTKIVTDKLGDFDVLRKSRIHPIQLLSGLMTYEGGRSIRGNMYRSFGADEKTWTPVQNIIDALNEAFYESFKLITPTGKRLVLAIDCSGSMDSGEIAGVPGLNPRTAAAVMSLVTARTENQYTIVGFTSAVGHSRFVFGSNSRTGSYGEGLRSLNISPKNRLDSVVEEMQKFNWGGTDCALPMLWAKEMNIEADGFVIYTDNETYAGNIHPTQALTEYQQHSGINARMAVVGFTATPFTIADPERNDQMDFVGFDSAAPQIMSDFFRGDI